MNFLRYSFFGIALLILLTGCSRLTVLEGNNAIVYQDKERICRNVSDTMRDDFLLYRQKDIPVIQYFLLCYPTSRQSSDSPIQIAPIGSGENYIPPTYARVGKFISHLYLQEYWYGDLDRDIASTIGILNDNTAIFHAVNFERQEEGEGYSVIDESTFTMYNEYFAQDKDNTYYQGIKLPYSIDLSSLRMHNDLLRSDKNNVYYYTVGLLSGADGSSFSLLSSDGYLRKDKDTVYHADQALTGIVAATALLHGTDYLADANHVYYLGEHLVTGADASTFSIVSSLQDKLRAKDKTSFIYQQHILPDSNSATAELVGTHTQFVKDDTTVYFLSFLLSGADAATFEPVEPPFLQKDTSTLSIYYAKDKQHVFRCVDTYNENRSCTIVAGADPKTFRLIEEDKGKDKYRTYERGKNRRVIKE